MLMSVAKSWSMFHKGIFGMYLYRLERICRKFWILKDKWVAKAFQFAIKQPIVARKRILDQATYNIRFLWDFESGRDFPSPIRPTVWCGFFVSTLEFPGFCLLFKFAAESSSKEARACERSARVSPASCSLAFRFIRRA